MNNKKDIVWINTTDIIAAMGLGNRKNPGMLKNSGLRNQNDYQCPARRIPGRQSSKTQYFTFPIFQSGV